MLQTQKRLEMVQSELDRIIEEARQEGARRAEVEVTARSLRQELSIVGSERDELKVQFDQAVSKLEQLSGDVEAVEAAYRDGLGRLETLRAELSDARQSAHKAEERAAAAGTQAASLQSELIEAKEKAAEFEDQASELFSQLETRKAERDQLRKELDQAKSSLEAKSPRPEPGRSGLSIDPRARDYLIRTIVFEAGGETEIGKAAVAHVVLNRKLIGRWGDNIKDVVTYPWQFEPWTTRRDEIEKLSSQDHRYQDAAQIADAVLAGRIPDPTAGATHFINPVVVRQRRGGSLPSWADGGGKWIGRHVFYSPISTALNR
jgi:spore germination cell wall hydrolase CwlJ-like protein